MNNLSVAVGFLLLTIGLAGAQERRHLDAHEHGVGHLRIAVEGNLVAMELEVPGADIVGFEHPARSASERAATQAAIGVLAKPLTLFVVPDAAQCKVSGADIELHGDEDHDAKGRQKRQSSDAGAAHTEFHGTYRLECANPAAIAAIDFTYFKTFPGARELQVQVVTGKGAAAFEVEKSRPRIDLSAIQ